MRVRRSLLMGLGIMIALSVGVPVAATAIDSNLVGMDEQIDESPYEWTYDEENGTWSLVKKEDDTPVTVDGVYKWNGDYYFIEGGLLVTKGTVDVTEEDLETLGEDDTSITEGSYSVAVYSEEVNSPEKGLGKLILPSAETEDPEIVAGWKKVGDKWVYINEDGTQASDKIGWQLIEETYYFLNEDGSVDTSKNGIIEFEGKYLDAANGEAVLATGFQKIDGATYYLNSDGIIQEYTDCWVTIEGKAYYFNEKHQIASQNINGWKMIDGNWYWFENGKTATGWRSIGGKWYYMDPQNGIMKTGFFTDTAGNKYYCDSSGAMVGGGWHKLGSSWYWMHNSGAIAVGWLKQGNTWYYLDPANGAMKTGWYQDGSTWYYSDASGAMQTGWIKLGNTWYYLSGSGAMKTGWLKYGSTWYYLNPQSGAMMIGWYQDGSTWYYSYANGAMVSSSWIGDYYVGPSGAMLTNAWVDNRYWVGSDGKWIPNYRHPSVIEQTVEGNWERKNGNWYFRDKSGNLVTGWKYVGDYKYYFNESGVLIQDLDSVIGKQSSYYITVNRAKCQVMVYAKDETGRYCIPVKTFACSVGLPNTPTPTGTYCILTQQKIVTLMGPSWGKYGSLVVPNGGIWFHSVACTSTDPTYSLPAAQYNLLGRPASHGCIRLCVRDAKWIYDHCGYGTTVEIYDNADTPFDKPATIKIPASQNWDPTDPDAKR
ncbi:L,D-transpeptidase family protein [bacterium]|nr:L,D-transpeptidase family protein [bacterium]MDY3023416.1 L,D-transpeptidase family protein [Oliverpabstia sp.]